MGTWSVKPFGNDTALDWLAELQSSKLSEELINNTLGNILHRYDGDSHLAEQAIAAIALIAASANDPLKGISQEIKTWINSRGFVPPMELVEKSLLALEILGKDSELYDLWANTSSLNSWLKNITDLKNRLREAQKKKILPVRKPKKKSIPRALYKLVEYYPLHPEEQIREKIFAKIKKIENINEGSKDTHYELPIVLTAKYGLLEETKYLLAKDCQLDSKAFIWACVHGHFEIADLLLSQGQKMFAETIMDENTGYSYNPEIYKERDDKPLLSTRRYCVALFSVASHGKPEAIDYLVSQGADLHQLDLNGETLIHKACYHKNLATLERLIQLGVNMNASKGIVNGNKNSKGDTALHYAVGKDFTEGVRLLLEKGADPNIKEYFYGKKHTWENTPLDLVSEDKESEIYKLLSQHGGRPAGDLKNPC